jgi:hypothetical protein
MRFEVSMALNMKNKLATFKIITTVLVMIQIWKVMRSHIPQDSHLQEHCPLRCDAIFFSMARQPYMGLGLLVSSRFHDHTL